MARMLYDITRTIGHDTLTFPGDTATELRRVAAIADGAGYNLTAVQMSCHCGTHLDAPWHFIDVGAKLSDLPLARFILNAHVVDAGAEYDIGPEALARLALQAGDAVLFKTRNAFLPRTVCHPQQAGLTAELAARLVELKVSLAGIDYLSIELGRDGRYPVHEILLGAGALILEEADLAAVPPGAYRLYCLPLRLHATEAAPCRAVLESR